MEVLYCLGYLDSAKIYYNDSIILSRILKDQNYIQTIENLVKEKYPNLLE